MYYNEDDPFMSAGEAITWLITRNYSFSSSFAHAHLGRIMIDLCAIQPILGSWFEAGIPTMLLRNHCLHGNIRSNGYIGNEVAIIRRRRAELVQLDWYELELIDHVTGIVARPLKSTAASLWWHALAFNRSDVTNVWPPVLSSAEDHRAEDVTQNLHDARSESRLNPDNLLLFTDFQNIGGFGPIKTGAPGRPSGMDRIIQEFNRLVDAGQIAKTLAEQARVLSQWYENVRRYEPEYPSTTVKTIENGIRKLYNAAKAKTAVV